MNRFRLYILLVLAFLMMGMCAMACTTAVISAKASATGRPMLFKQRDSSVKFNYVDFFCATDSTFAFTGIVNTKDVERNEVWSGANTEGFAIMNSMSYGFSPLVTDERPWEGFIMKRALEICRTVDDFELYIKGLPQPNGLEANFGVIDAEGGAAYFEVHDYGYFRFDVSDTECGYIIRTNYSMMGREGEGRGYDRYDIAFAKMGVLQGGFSAEWLIDELGRDPVIGRKTTVSSTVIEGVKAGDRKDSSVLWCAPGYAPASYAIPTWVAAGDRIAEPLKTGGRGSALNELANRLLDKYFLPQISEDTAGSLRCHYENGRCSRILSKVRAAEASEFARGRALDGLVRSGDAGADAFETFNDGSERAYSAFASSFRNL